MSNKIIFALLSSTLAAGCAVDIEAPFSIARPCARDASCTFRGVTSEQQHLMPMMLASGSTLPIDLDGGDVLKSQYGAGPFSLDNKLTLDSIEIEPLDGVMLDGVEEIEVVRADGVAIASYDPENAAGSTPNALAIRGNADVNLLELGRQFTLGFRGAGRLPTVDWMANVTLNAHIEAKAQ